MDIYYILVYIITYIGLFATFFYLLNLRHYKKGNIPQEAEDKTVSILIPAYNEAESIGKTIESALALDYPKEKLEIIVIDDGSKDNSWKVIEDISKANPNIKYSFNPYTCYSPVTCKSRVNYKLVLWRLIFGK